MVRNTHAEKNEKAGAGMTTPRGQPFPQVQSLWFLKSGNTFKYCNLTREGTLPSGKVETQGRPPPPADRTAHNNIHAQDVESVIHSSGQPWNVNM